MTHDELVEISTIHVRHVREVRHEVYGDDATAATICAWPDARATWGRCERTARDRTIAELVERYGPVEARRMWTARTNHQAAMRNAKPGRRNGWAALDAAFTGRQRARRGSRRRG